MHPEQVLDMQMDMIRRLQDEPLFRRNIQIAMSAASRDKAQLAETSAESGALSSSLNNRTNVKTDNYIDDTGRIGTDVLLTVTKGAYAYRVTSDMCEIVVGMAGQFDADEVHDTSMAPTGCGIVRFDKPLPVHDVRGFTMMAHWLIWGPVAMKDARGGILHGIGCYWFNDLDDPDEIAIQLLKEDPEKYEYGRSIFGKWGWIGFNVLEDGRPLGEMTVSIYDDFNPEIVNNFYPEFRDGKGNPQRITNSSRYVHALWTLLNQTITMTEDEHVARPARRRAAKMNIPGRVTVIKMRRSEHKPSEGESNVEWQHRWIVRGHLAWRRCGPDKPGAVEYEGGWRRRIWVHPYVKGPEDMPFVHSEKLYDLSR